MFSFAIKIRISSKKYSSIYGWGGCPENLSGDAQAFLISYPAGVKKLFFHVAFIMMGFLEKWKYGNKSSIVRVDLKMYLLGKKEIWKKPINLEATGIYAIMHRCRLVICFNIK